MGGCQTFLAFRSWYSLKTGVAGDPEYAHISTMRRLTRLTNVISKKLENHETAIALHFMHYNFCRGHTSLRVTPAKGAGIRDHAWSLEEVIKLVAKAFLRITIKILVRHPQFP